MNSIWLTYRDVYGREARPGQSLCDALYHLSGRMFAAHLETIRSSGRPVITAGESISSKRNRDAVC